MRKREYSCFECKVGSINPIRHIKHLGRNIKHSYQRIRYGYCDRDVWSIDWWFLSVIPNMLEDLKNKTDCYPSKLENEEQAKPDVSGIVLEKNVGVIRKALKSSRIPEHVYSLGEEKGERVNLFLEDGHWMFTNVEKGYRQDEERYDNIDQACRKLFEQLSSSERKLRKMTRYYEKHKVTEESIRMNMVEEGEKRWKEILSEMIFLFREANEETCTRENPYEKEYWRASDEFTRKYGFFGEGLKNKEEKKKEKEEGWYRMYMPGDLPEYKDISDKHTDEHRKIREYQNACKDKGLDLFKEWFSDLWY